MMVEGGYKEFAQKVETDEVIYNKTLIFGCLLHDYDDVVFDSAGGSIYTKSVKVLK
jgi:hypothetical protein